VLLGGLSLTYYLQITYSISDDITFFFSFPLYSEKRKREKAKERKKEKSYQRRVKDGPRLRKKKFIHF